MQFSLQISEMVGLDDGIELVSLHTHPHVANLLSKKLVLLLDFESSNEKDDAMPSWKCNTGLLVVSPIVSA